MTDDIYYILVKEQQYLFRTSTITYSVRTVDLNGVYDSSNVVRNIALSDYEVAFLEDLNGDTVIGFNTANLAAITTDTSDTTGVGLKRDRW